MNSTDTTSTNPFDDWAELLAFWQGIDEMPDRTMYNRLAKQFGRPVVELGIGDGRVAEHVKPDYGVDFSTVMLQRCESRLKYGPQLLLSDLRDYHLPEMAMFSYMPLNTFNHITRQEDRRTVLRNILRNTTPGGYLAFDSIMPKRERLRARDNIPVFRSRHFSRVIFDVTSIISYDTYEAVIHAFMDVLDEQGSVLHRRYYQPMPFCFIFPEQYRELAETTAWEVKEVWGGFNGEPFSEESRVQVWLLQKPTASAMS